MMTTNSTHWTHSFMDAMRQTGDSPADQAIEAVVASGQLTAVNRLMKLLIENDAIPPADLPEPVRAYLDSSDDLPAWFNPSDISKGEVMFGRYGIQAVMILNCYSLPFAYAMGRGVAVLHETTRLYTNPRRRILETSQMIIDVMKPGGLGPGGAGIRSAQKVRLVHAGVRHLLLKHGWNTAELGVPINQEDLAGTLLTFSYTVLDGLLKLGVDLTEAEMEAYLHIWNAIGHFMGIRPELLAHTIEEAEALSNLIVERQYAPSPAGQQMTAALIACMEEAVPGKMFDGSAAAMIRFFIGDQMADDLAVPKADWTRHAIRPLRFLSALADDVTDQAGLLARAASVFGYKLLEGWQRMERGGDRTHFEIPATLRHTWHLPQS